MKSGMLWVLVTWALGVTCLDPTGGDDRIRLPAGTVPPMSDGCPATPIPFASCLEPGVYAFGVEPPAYRTAAPALPPGKRSDWDNLEAGTYGVSLPAGDGSNIAWYLGRDTALHTRIGLGVTADYTSWTKVAVSPDSTEANVVIAPTTSCDGSGFIGGFGITRLPGGGFAALVSAQAARPVHRRDFFDWCLRTSPDAVHWSLEPASPVYRLGNSDAPDDYITEVRGLIAVAGGYLTLAQVVRRRDAPVRRVALYFSPNLVTWQRAGLLSAAQRVDSQDHGAAFLTVPDYAEPLLVWERFDSHTTATTLYFGRMITTDSDVTADLFPQPALEPSAAGQWDSGQLFAWTQELLLVGGNWRMVYGGGAGTYNTAVRPRGAGYVDWIAEQMGYVNAPAADTVTVVTRPFRWGGRTPELPSDLVIQTSTGGNATLKVWCLADTTTFSASLSAGAGTLAVDSATVRGLQICSQPPFGQLRVTLPAGGRLYGWRQGVSSAGP